MVDPSHDPAAGPGNLPALSVSELSQALKRTIEDRFAVVRVRGEVTGWKRAASGHVYFCLKDSRAVLDAVMWRGTAARLGIRPEDGLEVIATGRLTTYPDRSRYQIVVDSLELAGVGALLAEIEERRRRLTAEGLFDPARRPPLPALPRLIGVVTSPTGAVIRDILHRLEDRFPCPVLIWPVPVQGSAAAPAIARAIAGFNALAADARPDLLIVARGGGSIEDLMAFNAEEVVRAAAASVIPLISAVGHETDTTLIDYAAARRAPTPTAAAELAVPVRAELLVRVHELAQRLAAAQRRRISGERERMRALARALPRPRGAALLARQRLDEAAGRLPRALALSVERPRARLDSLAGRLRPRLLADALHRQRALLGRPEVTPGRRLLDHGLAAARARLDAEWRLVESLSPAATLKRGYTLVRDEKGRLMTRRPQAATALEIEWADGRLRTLPAGHQGQLFSD